MARAEFNRIMDQLRIKLPGALDGTLQLEMFAVMKEFFQKSNCWIEDISFDVTPGETVYEIFPTNLASINRLMSVKNAQGRNVVAYMFEPGVVQLYSEPSEAATYTASVALTVGEPTDREGYPEFPDWVLIKYGDDIVDGVLGRMMSQIAKSYSQPQMAMYHMRRFIQAVSKAKVEAQHANAYRGQNWSFPQSFTRRKARW